MSEELKRIRSPNYPAIGLPSAIDGVTRLWPKLHQHPAARDVVLKGLGFKSYNGASAPVLSALLKYGLLERQGQDFRITSRATSIIHSHSRDEKLSAIKEAATAPALFSEIMQHFGGRAPANDELVRTFLIRRSFAEQATSVAIQAFRDTFELVASEETAYDSSLDQARSEEPMYAEPASAGMSKPAQASPQAPPSQEGGGELQGEREISRGKISRDGMTYRLLVSGDIGAKELGKIIKHLTTQRDLLADDDEVDAAH